MFLISADKSFPISIAEIKLELGLSSNEVDAVIEAGIASVCLMTPGTRKETWLVERDQGQSVADFLKRCNRLGRIGKVGEGHDRIVAYAGAERRPVVRFCHEVEVLPKPEAIRSAKAKILKWCIDQDDIHGAIVRQMQTDGAIEFLPAAE